MQLCRVTPASRTASASRNRAVGKLHGFSGEITWVPARSRRQAVSVRAMSDNPARAALSSLVSGIYKVTGAMAPVDPSLTPLWQAIMKLDVGAVKDAATKGYDVNERNQSGDTPLLYIARAGHYKYPPSDIPTELVKAGADMEAKDRNGFTALQVSLLSGWQNIAELLIKSGASTTGVASIKARLTCPDCKRLVAKYQL